MKKLGLPAAWANTPAAAAAPGETPPPGVVGVGGVGGVDGTPGFDFEVKRLKENQVSSSPSRERSVAPRTRTEPREPTTFAHTTRGDTPRWTIFTPRSLPFTSDPSRCCSPDV